MEILLNPKRHDRAYPDERSREVMRKTIEFFERKGKRRLKEDYHAHGWYRDFLDFVARERIFATMCTPAGYGAADARWDTWRICEFAEILGFYGLQYWYTWQVSVLGLGPIWMSRNEAVKQRAAQRLEEGAIFAFGLSEKAHGADIYSTDMVLTPRDEGVYGASGRKYYIGNGNEAAIVSTFGKLAGSDDYVFFAADSSHERYECVQNVCASQNFVSEFALNDYPLTEADILHKGKEAFYAALNTVNIGKYNLGWASIGICTHALYEAVAHAHNRRLYNMRVTDFPHVKRMFVDAYARLVAMKLFALRACDYMRSASPGRPALPALQPDGEDEGDHRGRARDQPALGRHRRQGLREEHVLRAGRGRHPRPAEARGHGAREHRADREVHAELLLRAGRAPRGAAARRRGRRRLPLRSGARRAGSAASASTTTGAPSPRSTCPT